MIIKLTKNTPSFKKGSARAKWFIAIKRYDNRPVDDFLAATAEKPPVLTESGEAESRMGWLRYFEREEVIELV